MQGGGESFKKAGAGAGVGVGMLWVAGIPLIKMKSLKVSQF